MKKQPIDWHLEIQAAFSRAWRRRYAADLKMREAGFDAKLAITVNQELMTLLYKKRVIKKVACADLIPELDPPRRDMPAITEPS